MVDMLVVVRGNHRGQRYPLEAGRTVIGRNRACDVAVEDEGVSRQHAAILRQNGECFVEDLGSTNGTYVNSLLIEDRHRLQHGDRISTGDTVFLLEMERRTSSSSERVVVSDRMRHSDEIIKVNLDSTAIVDLVRTDPTRETPTAPAAAQSEFLGLYNFISRISDILDLDMLVEKAVQEMGSMLGADRGAIFLLGHDGQLEPKATHPAGGKDEVVVSSTLLDEVLAGREGILSVEPAKEKRFRDTHALELARVTSMMGVPLGVQDKPLGAAYFDTLGRSRPLNQRSLQLASAMAMQLSTCIENAGLYKMLKDSEEFSACVLKCMAGGLLVVDRNGRVLRANDSAAELAGMEQVDLLRSPLSEVPALAELDTLLGQTLSTGKPQESEDVRLYPPDGEPFPVGVATATLEDYAGKPIGALAHFRDLTRLHELAERVSRAERLSALGRMASGIAHEIRNPLNSVQGFVQLLAEGAGNDQEREYCDIVLEEVRRINGIVQEMLDFARSRPEAMESMDISALLEGVIRQMRAELSEAGIDLQVRLPQSMPPVRVNADRIKQVLLNLLRNACQATPPGGTVTVFVEEAPSEEDARVRIGVQDTGHGIPEEEQGRIFDPFYTTRDDGTGLGLSICQQIAERHQGALTVESAPGKGSCFVLELPAGS
jgi:PAS domain S-box-containing protein